MRTRRQRSVRVWISAGPRSTIVPALVGESERTAQLRAARRTASTLAATAEIRSADYSDRRRSWRRIRRRRPSATAVSLLVNRGERGASYVMPDLIGVNGDRARRPAARAAASASPWSAMHPYPGVPAGIVLRQSPQAGFQIAPGEPISLEVSR